MAPIIIADESGDLSFQFGDLVRFHGTRSICGLTVSFKVMEAAWEALWQERPPKREDLTIASGFPGPGTKDGFEMVTRAVSRDAFEILEGIKAGPLVAEAAKGTYFFRLSDGQKIVELGLNPAVVPDEFIPRRRQLARGEATKADAEKFRALQFQFSKSLRVMCSRDAVNILDVRPTNP